MRLWRVEFVGTFQGRCRERGSSTCLLLYAAGIESCPHTLWPGKGRSEQDHSAVAIRTEVQIVVGYGLVFQIFLRELLAFVKTGYVLDRPTKCTFHYLLKGCLSCFHFNSDVLFFYYCVCGASCKWETHENRLVSFSKLHKFDAENPVLRLMFKFLIMSLTNKLLLLCYVLQRGRPSSSVKFLPVLGSTGKAELTGVTCSCKVAPFSAVHVRMHVSL